MKTLHRQQGVTLFMSMIMLVILTLLALSSFNVSQSNLQVVSNMQARDESLYAARAVIEEVISGTRFSTSPKQTLSAQTGCKGDNFRCIDTNGDGAADVTVEIPDDPTCVKVKILKTAQLDMNIPTQANCAVGASQTPGVVGANTGNSLCADSVWEVQAVATDDVTEAKVTVTQGIAVMTEVDRIQTSCPN